MKKIIFAFFLSIFVFHSYAQTDTATRYANIFKNFALYGVIAPRCYRYLPELKDSDCQRTVASMLKLIDSEMFFPSSQAINPGAYQPQAFMFIAFKTTLIELLHKKSTAIYLQDVLEQLSRFQTNEDRQVNLWAITRSHYPSQKAAAKVLAALFQDTSPQKLHLAYLETTEQVSSALYESNKVLLDRTIETLNMVLDYNLEDQQALLYPSTVKKSLNRNPYHFYVPFYLGLALKDMGVSTEMAYIAPLMMTISYEFVTTAHDYTYLFTDPQMLNPKVHAWKIKDIYAAHQGAAMAVGRTNVKSLNFLNVNFARSTAATVMAMLAP